MYTILVYACMCGAHKRVGRYRALVLSTHPRHVEGAERERRGIQRIAQQWLRFKIDPRAPTRYIYGTEIKPGKHPDTRIKPLPLANGHGRYITVTPERALMSVGGWPLHI